MKFEKPELKLVRFDWKDVLTASGNTGVTEAPSSNTGVTEAPSSTEENELPAL